MNTHTPLLRNPATLLLALAITLVSSLARAGDGLNFSEKLTLETVIQGSQTSQVATVVASFRGSIKIPWLARVPLTNLSGFDIGSLFLNLALESAPPDSIRTWTANRIVKDILRDDDGSNTNAARLGTVTLTRQGNTLSLSGSFMERTTNGFNRFIVAPTVAADTSIPDRDRGSPVSGVVDFYVADDLLPDIGFTFGRTLLYEGQVRDGTETNGPTVRVTTSVTLKGRLKPLPAVAILEPRPNQRFTNEGFRFHVEARDGLGVEELHFELTSLNPINKAPDEDFSPYLQGSVESGNPFEEYSELVSFDDYPLPGWQELRVWAVDAYGQASAVRAVRFYLLVTNSIIIDIAPPGAGTVIGPASGQLVEYGLAYTLEPRARAGYVFSRWEPEGVVGEMARFPAIRPVVGGLNGNAAFTAVFVTNPFPAMKGEYAGLVLPDISSASTNPPADTLAAISPENAGSIKIMAGVNGTFSGKLSMAGANASFAGIFDPVTGLARPVGQSSGWLSAKRGQEERFVSLSLALPGDVNHPPGTMSGVVYFEGQYSSFLGYRSAAQSGDYAGRYTFVIPGAPRPNPLEEGEGDYWHPSGHGAGTMILDQRGSVRFMGTLGDGTPFTGSAPLNASNAMPLHVSPYGRRGVVLGWVGYDTAPPTNGFHLSGLPFYWMRAPATRPTDRLYPQGIRELSALEGRRYTPAGTLAAILRWPVNYGYARLVYPGLSQPSNFGVVVFGHELVRQGGDPDPTIRVDLATGLFSGRFRSGYPHIPFRGALLQFPPEVGGAIGAGWFLSPFDSPSSGVSLRSE